MAVPTRSGWSSAPESPDRSSHPGGPFTPATHPWHPPAGPLQDPSAPGAYRMPDDRTAMPTGVGADADDAFSESAMEDRQREGYL